MKFYNTSINDIAYTLQMSHKHILKLIGCCLETQTAVLWSMELWLEREESESLSEESESLRDFMSHFFIQFFFLIF